MSAPTPLRVRLPFRSEDEFVAHYGAHVGRDGFFLATKAPKPVGAQLLFDLILADGRSLLRGEGVVVRSNASGERPGMTLRFVRLEAAGKALVERIVSGRAATGGASPEALAHPSGWAPPAGPSAGRAAPLREAPPRPAHPEAWAPPEAPARPGPSAPARPGPVPEPQTEEPEEVSPEAVSEASPAELPTEAAEAPAESSDVSTEAAEAPAESSDVPTEAAEVTHPEVSATPAELPPEPLDEPTVEPGARVSADAAEPRTPPSSDEGAGTLEDTSLEAWSAARDRARAAEASDTVGEMSAVQAESAPEKSAPVSPDEVSARVSPPPAAAGLDAQHPEEAAPPEVSPPAPASPRTGTTGPHPPLDDLEVPELVVTEFTGPGPRRPAGLEHTRASADVHAAITPPAGTLIATELDEPPPEPQPRFQLDAPVREDEPLHVPESSFHDVAQSLTTPIPLLPSMETAGPEEVPIPPPPPPLDEAPILEEGAMRIEPGADLAPAAAPEPAPPLPLSLVPAVEASGAVAPVEARGAPVASMETPAPSTAPAPERTAPAGTTELGIEINPESIGVSWFHDGRAEPLLLDQGRGHPEAPVRLVREPGAPPRMLPPEAPDVPLWVGAPLPFLGTRADSDASRTVARRWPAALVPDDRGESAFALEGGTVGATELVATLLRWVRHRAEELTSHQPGRVVLTVPVAFNTVQRERLREAAERAGFEGVRLVQAPTAATMAFAHGRGLARRRILVFRMGASTCDIAVLAASGDDLDMVACGGDASLGSVNFDEQIALALDKGARADAGVLRKRIGEAAQLRAQLEDASLAEASVEGARLSRAELEARTTALVERGVLLAREVLRSASLAPESLDELVLVGPPTRLPHVRRMIEEAMGRPARTDVDVGAAVSTGAATLAHLLVAAGPKSASRTALHEVLGVPLEIIAPELGQVRVLDRNTRLPAEKTLTLTLGLGAPLEIQVFQGTARAPDPRSFLGLLRAPADRAGDWTLHLSVDTDGVLRAAATNPAGKRQPLELQMPAPTAEAETPPAQRAPSEPETLAAPPKQETGVLGGLKRLFGRR